MEKIIEIDGKQVRFKSNGAVPLRYKAQFQRDFFKDLLGMGLIGLDFENMSQAEQIEAIRKIDFDLFYNIAWTFAKTADQTIPEPIEWLDGFDVFPIIEIVPQLQELLIASLMSKKN